MATGTGKTFTMVNQIYRLMKCGVAKRVLFLVDRRALAAQAVRAFAAFDAEPGMKFDQDLRGLQPALPDGGLRRRREVRPEGAASEVPDRPASRATPSSTSARSSAWRSTSSAGRRSSVSATRTIDEDADKLDIPIHAFDVIVADECHRGYTGAEAVGVAQHARPLRRHQDRPHRHAGRAHDGVLQRHGLPLRVRAGHPRWLPRRLRRRERQLRRAHEGRLPQGRRAGRVRSTPRPGCKPLDQLEDERQFDTTEIERKVTAPDSNRKILEEVKKYAEEHEQKYGRLPKTLIFAANDLPHTSHADQLVDIARDVFGRGESFVAKITGRVDRPLQRIREFRNRPNPGIVVSVDLLSTGVDIPDLEFIVFLRPVKSRILFEQMLGRGTRKGEKFPDKSHFTVFDCFDGTLLAYFRKATGITAEPPDKPTRTIKEIIDDIWSNRDRDYNVGCLVKRLHRIDKEMSADARTMFAAYVSDGDLGALSPALCRRHCAPTSSVR